MLNLQERRWKGTAQGNPSSTQPSRLYLVRLLTQQQGLHQRSEQDR